MMKKPKLGFLIETKLNESFLRRILDENFEYIDYLLTSAVNHASIYGSFFSIIEYYQQGYDHVFMLFETNTFDEEIIQEQIEYFYRDVRKYGLEDYVTYVPIRPHFQNWIRPKMKTFIEEKHDFLLFGYDPNNIKIDVEQMKQEVPDFKKFMETIGTF